MWLRLKLPKRNNVIGLRSYPHVQGAPIGLLYWVTQSMGHWIHGDLAYFSGLVSCGSVSRVTCYNAWSPVYNKPPVGGCSSDSYAEAPKETRVTGLNLVPCMACSCTDQSILFQFICTQTCYFNFFSFSFFLIKCVLKVSHHLLISDSVFG